MHGYTTRLAVWVVNMLRRPALPGWPDGGEPGWRALARSLCAPYRPEQHYMRGPGPKYRARQLGAEQASAQAARDAAKDPGTRGN